MAKKVNTAGRVIEETEIGGRIGVMQVLSNDLTDAKIDPSGNIYKETEINGITGRMPVVSVESNDNPPTPTITTNDTLTGLGTADNPLRVSQPSRVVTESQYDALTSAEQNNEFIYFIKPDPQP